MIGAIASDIIGSVYESISGRRNIKTTDFPLFDPRCRFTDDSVLTVAVADSLFHPEAITAFQKSRDFEDAVRKAVSLGGDSDTIACIAGGIAEAFYGGVPEPIARRALEILDPPLVEVVTAFGSRYRR